MEIKKLNGFEYFKLVFKKYAQFNGRSTRSEYWYFVLFSGIISLVLSIIFEFLSTLFTLLILIPSLSVQVRRLHDVGRSGWLVLVSFIIVISFGFSVTSYISSLLVSPSSPSTLVLVSLLIVLLWSVYMLFLMVSDSQPGANKYGPNPKESSIPPSPEIPTAATPVSPAPETPENQTQQ